MPRLSCWFIRAALLYLLLGFTIGGLLLAQKGVALQPLIWRALQAHAEFLLLGWVLQMALGVGYWVLPRTEGRRQRGAWAWASLVLLNGGIWMVALPSTLGFSPWTALLGRTLELGGVVSYLVHVLPRVRPAPVPSKPASAGAERSM